LENRLIFLFDVCILIKVPFVKGVFFVNRRDESEGGFGAGRASCGPKVFLLDVFLSASLINLPNLSKDNRNILTKMPECSSVFKPSLADGL
jgi:hypothetical protein